jgi:hypothetical protein
LSQFRCAIAAGAESCSGNDRGLGPGAIIALPIGVHEERENGWEDELGQLIPRVVGKSRVILVRLQQDNLL